MEFLIHGLACPNWARIVNTWFCTAWPASFRALFAALVKYTQRGGAKAPPFGYIVGNAANNALNDAAGLYFWAREAANAAKT